MQIPAHVNVYHQLDFADEMTVVELPPEEGARQWDLAVKLQQDERPASDR